MQWLLIPKGWGKWLGIGSFLDESPSSQRVLTGEEEIKQLAWDILKMYLLRSPCDANGIPGQKCVYFFPEFTSNTRHRCSLMENSRPVPDGEYTTSFRSRRALCKAAPNHKHLQEPASSRAAATTLVVTLQVPPNPWLYKCCLFSPATVHASERLSHSPAPWSLSPVLNTGLPGLGELCLWGNTTLGQTTHFPKRSRCWRITHLWLRNKMGSYTYY